MHGLKHSVVQFTMPVIMNRVSSGQAETCQAANSSKFVSCDIVTLINFVVFTH